MVSAALTKYGFNLVGSSLILANLVYCQAVNAGHAPTGAMEVLMVVAWVTVASLLNDW